MRTGALLVILGLVGCYQGADPDQAFGTGGDLDTDGVGGSTGDGPEPAWDPPEGNQEWACNYTLVHEQPGLVLQAAEGASSLDVTPLAAGEGFYCLRAEFDMTLPDNLEALAQDAAAEEHCPTHLAAGSIFGSAATGDYLATVFFRAFDVLDDGTCEPGPPRMEVGNYLNYTENEILPWEPGATYRVMIEARPWVTRTRLFTLEGKQFGPTVEAALWNATVADTRDPVVRLGQPKVSGGVFFPWYDAVFENLTVEADVAPAEG